MIYITLSAVTLWVILFSSLTLEQQDSSDKQDRHEISDPMTFSAEPAPEWTSLMERTSGWFGADGIFSIPLNGCEQQLAKDKKTLFVFSDTYIGEVKNGVPLAGNVMVNNSTAWMRGTVPREDSI